MEQQSARRRRLRREGRGCCSPPSKKWLPLALLWLCGVTAQQNGGGGLQNQNQNQNHHHHHSGDGDGDGDGDGSGVAWPVTVAAMHPDHESMPWMDVASFVELEQGCRRRGGGKFRITANFKFPRHITISGTRGDTGGGHRTTQVTISGLTVQPAEGATSSPSLPSSSPPSSTSLSSGDTASSSSTTTTSTAVNANANANTPPRRTFTLHGQNRTNFFSVRNNASLLVMDLHFTRGRSVLGGGVSLMRSSRGAFARVHFSHCHSGVDGGAIRAKESQLALVLDHG